MDERKELVQVAQGERAASLVIKNGRLVNVYSGELLEGFSVAITGNRVAYVGPDIEHTIGDKTEIIDASGKILAPGFIDGHFHLFIPLEEFLEYSMPRGTTTVFMETDIGYNFGYEAAIAELENMKGQPIDLFGLASIYVKPPSFLKQEKYALSMEDYARLLAREDVAALGESFWASILAKDDHFLGNIAQALATGKPAEGHGAGTKGNKLVAFAASGISSCHESIKSSEMMDRLRLGLCVMIREGSVRRDLEAIAEKIGADIDFRRLCLVSDGLNGEDLLSLGHMDFIVQKAINLGIDPIRAFQMATLNPAEHFGLDHMIGGIAPGRLANILVLPSLTRIECEVVISNGRIAARNGKALLHPKKCAYPESVLRSIHVPHDLKPKEFRIKADGKKDKATVRVMKLINELITQEIHVTLPVVDHSIFPDLTQDILKVSVIDRIQNTGKIVTGFIQGFGLQSGAVASSYSWPWGSPLIVVGTNDQDMASAVNRIVELQGGLVVADNGKIPAELPLPIGGLLPSGPLEKSNHAFLKINQTLKQMGSPLKDPFMTLQTTAGFSLPFFRITLQGLVDLKNQKLVELIVD